MADVLEIWVDGSAEYAKPGNPKKGEKAKLSCGYHITTANGEVLEEKVIPLGHGTINQCEYAAVIYGLYRAKELGAKQVRLYSDSFVVVYLVNNREKRRKSKIVGADEWTPKLQAFIDKNFDLCEVVWEKRRQNKAHGVIARHQALLASKGWRFSTVNL